MKTSRWTLKTAGSFLPVLAAVLVAGQIAAAGPGDQSNKSRSAAGGGGFGGGGGAGSGGGGAGVPPNGIVINGFEPVGGYGRPGQTETTWLGVATEEASEALTAQLDLDPGIGLVATYVTTNSPAAKAGLQKNDVLVEFQGQQLVHPLQLRKLVQVRKEGDTVKLVFYRAGKKQTVSVTLGKTTSGFGFPEDAPGWPGYSNPLGQFGNMSDAYREQMRALREQMGNVKIDQKKVQEEILRSMEDSRKSYQEALRQATNANPALDAELGAELKNLAELQASMNSKSTITVRNTGRSTRSLVQADDSGSIVLVSNPKLYLTAHDQDGKLLFDAEIETAGQRAKVPPNLWNKVEPLLKKMTSNAGNPPDAKPVPADESSSLHGDDSSL